MTAEQMRELVQMELVHIPRGDIDQNMLRATYEQARLNSLGGKPQVGGSRGKVLRFSIEQIRKSNPATNLTYDTRFFE